MAFDGDEVVLAGAIDSRGAAKTAALLLAMAAWSGVDVSPPSSPRHKPDPNSPRVDKAEAKRLRKQAKRIAQGITNNTNGETQ